MPKFYICFRLDAELRMFSVVTEERQNVTEVRNIFNLLYLKEKVIF